MIITAKELAARLNGREYGSEVNAQDNIDAKESGLIVVYGYSDDNVEIEGAIREEIGAYEGTTFVLAASGPLSANLQEDIRDMDDMPEDAFLREVAAKITGHQHGKKVQAIYGKGDYTWQFETDIPHETFDIMYDGDKFCRGMVIRMDDLKAPPPVDITALTERAERAESLACSILESLKITPHSLLVIKTGDVMTKYVAHEVIKTFQRVVPENVAIVLGDEKLDIEMLDEGQMREAGWVRDKAIDPTLKAIFQRAFFPDGRASVSAFQRINKESWNTSRDMLQKLHDDGWLEGMDISRFLTKTDTKSETPTS